MPARFTKNTSSCHEVLADHCFEIKGCASELFWPMCILAVPRLERATAFHPCCAHRCFCQVRATLELMTAVSKSAHIPIPATTPHVISAKLCFTKLLPEEPSLFILRVFFPSVQLVSRLKAASTLRQHICEREPGFLVWVSGNASAL